MEYQHRVKVDFGGSIRRCLLPLHDALAPATYPDILKWGEYVSRITDDEIPLDEAIHILVV